MPTLKRKLNREKNYITPEEFKQLLYNRPSSKRESERRVLRFAAITMLLYNHGLRRKELCNLLWEDIRLNSNPPTIFVRRAKGGISGTHRLHKGEKPVLEGLWKFSREKRYVIEGPEGQKIGAPSITAFFARIKHLSFKVTPHMLRHGCGYRMINNGVPIRVVQDYLGHANIANTVLYSKLDERKFEGIFDYEE